MAFELRQSQRLAQDLRMTPQLQQAIKLLQLTHQELSELVQQEIVENPMLEEAPDWSEETVDADADRIPQAALDGSQEPSTVGSTVPERTAERAVNDIDWEKYLENSTAPIPGGGTSGAGRDGEELPSYDQTLTRAESLSDHLLWQLGVTDCSPLERRLGETIIGNLDDDGYLRDTTIEEVAADEQVEVEQVEEALLCVQSFDPIGVGARSLKECLLLQARFLYPTDQVLHRVIEGHIPDLERKNYPGIARALGVSRQEAMDAHRLIMNLDPKPGRQFMRDETMYIVPDVFIIRQDDEWIAVLNDDGLPRLRVSDYYRRALRASGQKDAKAYVQERLRSAWWLIRSIQQRQRTIQKVAESLIRFQRDFLDLGVEHLRPLVLREVADDIGMHESTISRVTTNKYVHTPRGVFEMKYFFNSSIRTQGGDDVAAESVKHHIRTIISSEPPDRPFSDQKLVEILKKEHNIEIARRTVAKYREMLGVLSSSKRRQLV